MAQSWPGSPCGGFIPGAVLTAAAGAGAGVAEPGENGVTEIDGEPLP